jgi:hypothetical protein
MNKTHVVAPYQPRPVEIEGESLVRGRRYRYEVQYSFTPGARWETVRSFVTRAEAAEFCAKKQGSLRYGAYRLRRVEV